MAKAVIGRLTHWSGGKLIVNQSGAHTYFSYENSCPSILNNCHSSRLQSEITSILHNIHIFLCCLTGFLMMSHIFAGLCPLPWQAQSLKQTSLLSVCSVLCRAFVFTKTYPKVPSVPPWEPSCSSLLWLF